LADRQAYAIAYVVKEPRSELDYRNRCTKNTVQID